MKFEKYGKEMERRGVVWWKLVQMGSLKENSKMRANSYVAFSGHKM